MASNSVTLGKAYVLIGSKLDATFGKTMRTMRKSLGAAGASLTSAGTKMAGLGAVMAAPMIIATRAFTEFDDQMRQVGAISNAMGKDFLDLTGKAKDLGATTSFTASEVADGMKYMGMAGMSTKEIIAGIPAVLDLARAGVVELGTASDIVTDVGSAFGFTANEIVRVADVMAKTSTSANTTVEMMGEAMKYVAPIAKVAGQSIEEVSAAIGLLGNVGIKGSMAGTGLSVALSKIADPASSKRITDMGVQITDTVTGGFRPFLDILKDLGVATAGMGEAEKLTFFMEVFDQRAAKSVISLANAGKGIDEMRAKMEEAPGSARKMAEAMDAGIGGALRILTSAMEGVQLAIGAAFEAPITRAARSITVLLSSIRDWVAVNQRLVVTVGAVAAGLVVAGGALIAVGLTLSTLGFAIGGILTSFSLFTGTLGLVGAAITALASPVGVAVAAIVGLGLAFVAFTESGGEMIQWFMGRWFTLYNGITEVLGAVSTALTRGDIEAAAQVLWSSLELVWAQGIAAITEPWAEWKQGWMLILLDLEMAWSEMTFSLANSWTDFTGVIENTWGTSVDWIAEKMIDLQGVWDKTLDTDKAKGFIREAAANRAEELKKEQEGIRGALLADQEDLRKKYGEELAAAYNSVAPQVKIAQDALDAAKKNFAESLSVANGLGAEEADGVGKGIIDKIKNALKGTEAPVFKQKELGLAFETQGAFSASAAGQIGSKESATIMKKQLGVLESIDKSIQKQSFTLAEWAE